MSGNDGISGIISDKLDKNNFHAWKFKMINFFMGKGYWEYVEGEHEKALECLEGYASTELIKALKDWN